MSTCLSFNFCRCMKRHQRHLETGWANIQSQLSLISVPDVGLRAVTQPYGVKCRWCIWITSPWASTDKTSVVWVWRWGSNVSALLYVIFQYAPFLACRYRNTDTCCLQFELGKKENMGSEKGAGMWEACVLCLHPHSNLSNEQRFLFLPQAAATNHVLVSQEPGFLSLCQPDL